jgi:GGDEF domain-containing protein
MTWAEATLSGLTKLLATATGPHSLAVLDVDGRAAINAAHGRPVGDAVLDDAEKRLAAAFADVLTERWVGDQFLVVLPFSDSAEAAERLDAVLGGSVESSAYSLCAGGATSPLHGSTNLDLMASAAAALRRAKLLGPGHLVWSGIAATHRSRTSNTGYCSDAVSTCE